jgi:hypothetical protein
MSGLLYGIGAFAAVVGAVLIGFGIPINEFSFGNTLILAGTTAVVGGLIVIALGIVVAQLRHLAEVLPGRASLRPNRSTEMFEPPAGPRAAPSQSPFPPRPKSEAGIREPQPAEFPATAFSHADPIADVAPVSSPAPTLRNPYEAPATVDDEDVSLSPPHPVGAPDYDAARQPHTTYFDAMWPAETKPAKSPPEKASPDIDSKPYAPKYDTPSHEYAAAPARPAEPAAAKPRPAPGTQSAAILKSGVVDGMGYTLYVDGSIEAELPNGTLRFASINELRSHLENNA